MNLKSHIRPELWAAISSTYLNESYKHAINDAMHYLSNILREKSGADSDGSRLVADALGGNNPKLRINKFQTESEKSEQAGYLQILTGMYQGIRNPRSHEQMTDNQETADAIILFIDYLVWILNKSQSQFSINKFLSKALDPSFVATEYYAKLLIEQVPLKKRLDILIELYRNKEEANVSNLRLLIQTLIDQLKPEQITLFVEAISEDLEVIRNDNVLDIIINIVPAPLWSQISELARIRIENKLLKHFDEAEQFFIEGSYSFNVSGSWAYSIIQLAPYWTDKSRLFNAILRKLQDRDPDKRRYAAGHFLSTIPILMGNSERSLNHYVRVIKSIATDGDHIVLENFALYYFPFEIRKILVDRLSEVIKPDGNKLIDPDIHLSDIPF